MKQIFLLRHAKSDWSDPFLADHDRPLNKRGRSAAHNIGKYLKLKNIQPDLITCSSAVRTQETLACFQEKAELTSHIKYDSILYGASADQILAVIQCQPPEVSSLMIIGHNPGIEDIALNLTGTDPSNQLPNIYDKVPTGSLITYEFGVNSWAHISLKSGTLTSFVRPKHELMEILSSKSSQS